MVYFFFFSHTGIVGLRNHLEKVLELSQCLILRLMRQIFLDSDPEINRPVVTAHNLIVTSIEVNILFTSCVVLEQDPITVTGCLRLFVFVLIVIHVAFVSWFKFDVRLNIARVLDRAVDCMRLASR